MNKLLVLIICIIPISSFSQNVIFEIPDSNDGYFDKKVHKNDTVIILVDNANILSEKTYKAYISFKDKYISCLESRQGDVTKIQDNLKNLDAILNEIMAELEKSEAISSNFFETSELKLLDILTELNSNIDNLKSTKEAIDLADNQLQQIRKQLHKEKNRLLWKKFGDILISSGLGILIGALIFG